MLRQRLRLLCVLEETNDLAKIFTNKILFTVGKLIQSHLVAHAVHDSRGRDQQPHGGGTKNADLGMRWRTPPQVPLRPKPPLPKSHFEDNAKIMRR